ncbi:MAG: hypothetical protein ACYTGV_05235 [Planctomycetota bacterium]|jgi:hypothetical protein
MEQLGFVLVGVFLKAAWDWLRARFRSRAERNRIRNFWIDEIVETQTELRGLFSCLRDEDQASTAAPDLYALALESAITRHMDSRDTLSVIGREIRESILVFYRNVRGMIAIVKGARAKAERSDLHRLDFEQLHDILPDVLLRGRQACLLLQGGIERPWPGRAWKRSRDVVSYSVREDTAPEAEVTEREQPEEAQPLARGSWGETT